MVQGVADKLLVPFVGEGSGSGVLSWGQQTIWRAFEAAGTPIWLAGVKAVPDGSTVEDVADRLAFLMSRHQSMRTRLLLSDDGPIQQVLSASGEIQLQIVDAADDADPHEVAKAIAEDWLERDIYYDYAEDWPVRQAVIRHRGVPAWRVRATSHLVTDGFGVMAMQADLAGRDPVTGSPSGPITAMEPLEQARWQSSPAGQRRSKVAEKYWQRLLQTIPARRFPEPADKPEARYGRVAYESRAAYLAIQAIAARTEVDTSPVLLAAFAVGLARSAGINPVVPRVYVSNRFRPRLATTVSPIAQTCPCVIDVAGITFDEAVKRTYYASLGAYMHAYFEPVKIRELLAATSEERGEEIDLNFVYNDIRLDSQRQPNDSPAGPDDIRATLPLSTLRWEERPEPEDLCNIMIQDSPDTINQGAISPGTINVLLLVDSHYIARPQVEAFLREMEAVLVDAAFDPDVRTGV